MDSLALSLTVPTQENQVVLVTNKNDDATITQQLVIVTPELELVLELGLDITTGDVLVSAGEALAAFLNDVQASSEK